MLCLGMQAQTYSFEEQKTLLGYMRAGSNVSLTDNPEQQFAFSYLPGGGDKVYAEGVYFSFSSNEQSFKDFMSKDVKEVYSIKIVLDDGSTISHSYDVVQLNNGSWSSAPIEASFTEKDFGVACMFPLIKSNESKFTFTNRTKPKDVMKWNDIFKINLIYHDIKSIDIVARSSNAGSDKKDRHEFHYDITKSTKYIFKNLIYDYKFQ